MKKEPRKLIILFATAAISVLLLISYRTLRAGTVSSVHSCVASISASLTTDQLLGSEIELRATAEWRGLEDSETDRLISKTHPYDCSGSVWPRWGERARQPG